MPASMNSQYPGSVLVVDDDASARSVLQRVLARGGHSVAVAETAEQALAMLAAAPFDLLLADKNLPGMSGLELLRRVRLELPQMQLILMTAYPTPEALAAVQELGVFDYLTKPFGILEIVATCGSAIRAARRSADRHRPLTAHSQHPG